jgi:uncharacterized protein YndB with AHSA1/START domain
MMMENSTTQKAEFVITRTFDFPRDMLWKAFTEVEHLKKWWGPKGFTIFHATLDFRPGGTFHYGMKSQGGEEMWAKFVYRDIVPHEKISYVLSFSDAEGNLTKHPASPTWPMEMLNTIMFVEEDGKTTITLKGTTTNASPEEEETYHTNHESMRQGYGGTWDQLDEYLDNL